MNHHRLELEPEDLRRLGYRIVDLIVEHQRTLPDRKAVEMIRWRDSAHLRQPDFPEQGIPADEVLDRLFRDYLQPMARPSHPRFFAFVPSPSNMVSALADSLISAINAFAGNWMEASGPTSLELATVDWLRRECGLPAGTQGLFVSGGSAANLTAMAVARRVKLGDDVNRAVVYCSDQTHSSVERGWRVLGFPPSQIVKIPANAAFRLSMDALEARVAADRADGRRPFCVVANAGTTNTGAIDPLPELARFCRREGIWLHADGAYGAASALCPRGRRELDGIDLVDSLSIDPHKWLFQPFEMGCVLVRDGERLADTFRIFPEYLQDVHSREGVNFGDRGLQLTRSFRALKLWLSLQVFGVAAFREAIERGFVLAEAAESRLRNRADWEVVSPARMAIVCFRHAPAGMSDEELDDWNSNLARALFHDGFAAVTTTRLRSRTVLRMCPINPRTTETDIDSTIGRLEKLAEEARG